jgi:peptide chain release factor 1
VDLQPQLDRLVARHKELSEAMATMGGPSPKEFVRLSKEYAELTPVVDCISALRKARSEADELEALIADPANDAEMRQLARDELTQVRKRLPDLEQQLKLMLLPKDEADE